MRILFVSNSDISQPLADWLTCQAHETVCAWAEKLSVNVVKNLHPDLLVSYNYRHIIREEVLNLLERKTMNLHISLLPWNRGAHPNLWSFLDGTAKGVTIHLIEKGVDTGDILLQHEVFFDEEVETLESSYKKLHQEIQKLFITHWDDLKHERLPARKQIGRGTKHYARECEELIALFGETLWQMPIRLVKQKYQELCKSKKI